MEVGELGSRWGQWDSETRTLTLSEALIREYPWDVILEVLKHEMAHQIVSETYGGDEGHGALFHQVCRKLGVLPWAMRAETEALPKSSHEESESEVP